MARRNLKQYYFRKMAESKINTGTPTSATLLRNLESYLHNEIEIQFDATPWSFMRSMSVHLKYILLAGFIGLALIPNSQANADFNKVYVQCAVAQGNGFNWASTVGWLAAEVGQLANAAKDYNDTHAGQAGVDVSCFTGSSSSGFTAALLNHLLNNPNLISEGNSTEHRILTANEAFQVSQALYYLALSMDFNMKETTIMLGSAIAARLGATQESGQHNIDFNFWGASSAVPTVKQYFAKWITAADLYHPDWANNGKNISSFVKQQVRGKTPKDLAIGNDFCVTAFVIPIESAALPLDYSALKILYVCNQETVRKLVDTKALRTFLNRGSIMKDRLMIGWTRHWSKAHNITVREPELTTELSGSLTGNPMYLGQAFELINGRFVAANAQTDYLVVGGFPDPRMQSWVGTVLLQKRMQELQKDGYEVFGRMVVFGKTENREDSLYSFAQKTVVKYFTNYFEDGNWSVPKQTLNSYYNWQDDYCAAIRSVGGVQFDFYRMDWNLTKQPAAITRLSQQLTSMGYQLSNQRVGCKL